jgi:hypothetical protein
MLSNFNQITSTIVLQSFVLFIRSPLAALLHAELTGKCGEGDVVVGVANARKKYNTVCLWIKSVQPVCGYNCNSVRLWTQFVRCLWIQGTQRPSVEKHHSPYICKENTDLSMKAS